jgi:uncharacterized phiE125 gp8 family phage protein
MSRRTALTSPPAQEPTGLALANLKAQCRADSFTDDDTYIAALGIMARRIGETHTKTSWVTQTWTLYSDSVYELITGRDPKQAVGWYPALWYGQIRLPKGPIQSVTSFKYSAGPGLQLVSWDMSQAIVSQGLPGRIGPVYGQTFPVLSIYEPDCVQIEYVAGFDDAGATVPQEWIQGALLLVGHFYEHREAVSDTWTMELPLGIASLFSSSGGELGVFN